MRLICYLVLVAACSVFNASAQSFSSGSGIASGSDKATAATADTADTAAADAAADAAKPKDAPIIGIPAYTESNDVASKPDVVVNISGDEQKVQEPVYDNSEGKVVSFKIVNGKLVHDDERKILVSYDDFSVSRGMDNLVRCKMRIYVLNDMTERLNSFGIKLIWPEITTAINLVKVNPGVRTYRDVMLLGDGCFSMDKNPTIEVNRCRVKGKTEEQCANAVMWYKKQAK
jgi:hypothetical protein